MSSSEIDEAIRRHIVLERADAHRQGAEEMRERLLAVAHEAECVDDDDHFGVCLILREHLERKECRCGHCDDCDRRHEAENRAAQDD